MRSGFNATVPVQRCSRWIAAMEWAWRTLRATRSGSLQSARMKSWRSPSESSTSTGVPLSLSDRDPNAPAEYVSLTAELSESDVEQAEIVFHERGELGLEVRRPALLPIPAPKHFPPDSPP